MRRSWAAVALAAAVAIATSCANDTQATKQHYVESGDRYAKEKQYSQAIIQYRNAVAADPTFGEARLKLGRAYEESGDLPNALREYVRAADLLPNNVEAQLRAGEFLIAAGRFAEARTRAEAVLAKEPKNINALIVMGNALAGLKDVKGAVTQIEGAIDAQPQLTFAYSNLAALQIKKGDGKAAEATFKRAVEVAPQSFDAHINLANFYWSVSRGLEAERQFKTALDIDPKSAVANQMLATLYMLNGRSRDAEPYLKTFVETTPTVASRLVLTDYYLREKRIAEATALLETLAQQKGGFAVAKARLAAISFNAGRTQEAYTTLEQALKQEPKDAVLLETKARFLLVEGKFPEMLQTIDLVVAGNPQAMSAHYLRGLALRNLGKVDEALKELQIVVQALPKATSAQLALADLLIAKGDFNTAIQVVGRVVKAEPRNGTAHFMLGQALLLSGNVRGAESQLVPIAKAYRSLPDVQSWLGRLYLEKKDYVKARKAFEDAAKIQPDSMLAFNGLVSLDVVERKHEAARARLEARLLAQPMDVQLLFLAANTYLTIGDRKRAETLLLKVIELAPAHVDAYVRIGRMYVAEERLDEAQKRFEQAIEHQDRPVGILTLLGMVLELQKKPEAARKQYARALDLDPRAGVAANNLAGLYLASGENLDVALKLAQTAKAALPDNADASDTLGWVYYKKGLAGLAIESLKQGTTQNPKSAMIHYHLGLAYLKNGERDEARRSLQRALQLDPAFRDAADAKRTLATIEG